MFDTKIDDVINSIQDKLRMNYNNQLESAWRELKRKARRKQNMICSSQSIKDKTNILNSMNLQLHSSQKLGNCQTSHETMNQQENRLLTESEKNWNSYRRQMRMIQQVRQMRKEREMRQKERRIKQEERRIRQEERRIRQEQRRIRLSQSQRIYAEKIKEIQKKSQQRLKRKRNLNKSQQIQPKNQISLKNRQTSQTDTLRVIMRKQIIQNNNCKQRKDRQSIQPNKLNKENSTSSTQLSIIRQNKLTNQPIQMKIKQTQLTNQPLQMKIKQTQLTNQPLQMEIQQTQLTNQPIQMLNQIEQQTEQQTKNLYKKQFRSQSPFSPYLQSFRHSNSNTMQKKDQEQREQLGISQQQYAECSKLLNKQFKEIEVTKTVIKTTPLNIFSSVPIIDKIANSIFNFKTKIL